MIQLKQFESIPFNHSALIELLKNYKSPNDKISRLIAKGDILKLKKGLYLNSKEHRSNIFSFELIANSIYGPSYISFETALSYYGYIPEKVVTIQSLTTKRTRNFNTPVGLFKYTQCNTDYFSIGISQEKTNNNYYFLIASPTKALCDKIVYTKNLSVNSNKNMLVFLTEDLRIEHEKLRAMDLSIISECSKVSKNSRHLELLKTTIENIN